MRANERGKRERKGLQRPLLHYRSLSSPPPPTPAPLSLYSKSDASKSSTSGLRLHLHGEPIKRSSTPNSLLAMAMRSQWFGIHIHIQNRSSTPYQRGLRRERGAKVIHEYIFWIMALAAYLGLFFAALVHVQSKQDNGMETNVEEKLRMKPNHSSM